MTSSLYPGGLDNDANLGRVDSLTAIGPADHNNLVDSIEAIETTLGINPQGASATVGARIAALGSGGGGSAVLRLNYTYAGSDLAPLVVAATTWVDVFADQAFTVGAGEPIVSVAVAGSMLGASGSNFARFGVAVLIDGATRLLVAGSEQDVSGVTTPIMVGAGRRYVTGLSAGTHHARVQVWIDVGGNVYLRPGALPSVEGLFLSVVEGA